MAFNDLQMKAASQYAVFAAHRNLAQISLFSHRFSELEGRPGESIAVPVYDLSAATDFNESTNNYGGPAFGSTTNGSGTGEIGGLLVNLDKHFVKSVSITDKELAYTGINWVKDTAAALAESITRGVNKEVFGCLAAPDISATISAHQKAISTYITLSSPSPLNIAKLGADTEKIDMAPDKCIVALDPDDFYAILGSDAVKYSTIGDGEYVKTGIIKNLFGFKAFVCTSNLPTGWKGAVLLDEAVGVASKYLAPMTPDAYPEAWRATSEEGFTIGFRRFMDLAKGQDKFAVDALFGAKVLQPSKVIKLV